jgi:hypothetical protein
MVGSLPKTLHSLDLTKLINEREPVPESDKGTLVSSFEEFFSGGRCRPEPAVVRWLPCVSAP